MASEAFFCGNFIVNLITRLPDIFHIRARHINFRWLFCVGIEVKWKMFKELSWRFVFRGLWNYLMAFRNIKLKGRGIFMKCHCRKFIMHNNTWRFSFRSSLIHFSILKRMKFRLKKNKGILELTWKVTYLNLISGKIIWLRVSSCCRLSSCGKTSTQFSIHRMFFYCMYSKCEVWMNGARCMIIDIFFTCTY